MKAIDTIRRQQPQIAKPPKKKGSRGQPWQLWANDPLDKVIVEEFAAELTRTIKGEYEAGDSENDPFVVSPYNALMTSFYQHHPELYRKKLKLKKEAQRHGRQSIDGIK